MREIVPGPNGYKILTPIAAGLTILSAGSVSGQVIYSGIKDNTFTTTSSTGIDFTGSGTDQFTLRVTPVNEGVPPSTFYVNKPQVTTDAPGAEVLAGGGFATPLTQGQSVKNSGTFSPGSFFLNSSSSDTYYGFEINPTGSQNLYGWAQVSYDGSSTGTLVDFAYEASGADISAGQTMSAVPEPADTAVLIGAAALLAGSVAVWRKRQGAELVA